MTIYIVDNANCKTKSFANNLQPFANYNNAFQFAVKQANRCVPVACVWFVDENDKQVNVYNEIPWSDNHIYIYERKM